MRISQQRKIFLKPKKMNLLPTDSSQDCRQTQIMSLPTVCFNLVDFRSAGESRAWAASLEDYHLSSIHSVLWITTVN